MKHPTDKRPSRSWLRRVVRGFWRWVEDLTRNDDEFAGLPQTLDEWRKR